MKKIESLRELSLPELTNRLNEARQEEFNLRFQQATRQLKNYRRIADVRHNVARILMLIGDRERQARGQT